MLNGNDMASTYVNSIIIAVPATAIPIMIAAFAAYAFTFMRFFGRDTLFVIVVALAGGAAAGRAGADAEAVRT